METSEKSAALELVKALAADRDAAERRFRLAIAIARSVGESVSEIAAVAELSTSRTNAILERHTRPPSHRVLSPDEREWVLENAFTVGIVPAGKIALRDYDQYSAYICQPNRSFRDEMTRLGFYAHREISPHFPTIRRTWESVPFNAEEAERQRASGHVELAEIVDRVLAAPERGGNRAGAHKVILLTPPGDPATITLQQPIKHLTKGRGQAFVRKQRYTTEAAIRREPKTTDELVRYERA